MTSNIVDQRDLTKPIVRRKQLSARTDATMLTHIDFGEYGDFATDEPVAHGGSGEGPSPLQAVLGALCGCESVTFRRTSTEMGFEYSAIEFEAEFTIDIRGRLGVREVRPHFQTIRVVATVTTSETPERLAEVVEETEKRCPVYNLVIDAGVNAEMTWVRKLPDAD